VKERATGAFRKEGDMTHAMEHCHRPWWKRPPVWFLAVAVVLSLIVVIVEQTSKQAAVPYSAFLDQIEADNLTSVTFHGTEIIGRLKRTPDGAAGSVGGDSFRSRVPDFGDPSLIPQLRSHHVAIEVTAPSAWTWLLGRVPWPMLIVVGAILVAGLVRLMRGGAPPSGSAAPTLPMHGMVGVVSGLFAKRGESVNPPAQDRDETQKQ
jgi:ATP-dependent Zn protease